MPNQVVVPTVTSVAKDMTMTNHVQKNVRLMDASVKKITYTIPI